MAIDETLAEQGDADAQLKLGTCYANGEGVTQDFEKAIYWLTKSAQQGNADAQFNLGVCYLFGENTAGYFEKAEYWFRKSAQQGNDNAKALLMNVFDITLDIDSDLGVK
ncbi:MAG: sel1 repeat family protein [Spirochaetes bacterium]|nr:sel1 repeat family protein [Spirochaetota bacterium]